MGRPTVGYPIYMPFCAPFSIASFATVHFGSLARARARMIGKGKHA
jgi:hypothetical protein